MSFGLDGFGRYQDELRGLQAFQVVVGAMRMVETNKSFQSVQSFALATLPGLPAAPSDELPREDEACLITFNTPCRQRIAANWPDENPEIEKRGSSRHAR